MKQSQKKERLIGPEAFDSYYSSLFDDWPLLKLSLLKDPLYVKLTFKDRLPYYLDAASACAALSLPVKKAEKIFDMCAAPGGKSLVLSLNSKSDASFMANERSPDRKKRLFTVLQESLPDEKFSHTTVTCSDAAVLCKKISDEFDAILLDAPCSSERHVLKDLKYLNIWTPSRIKSLAIEQWALLSSAWRMLKTGGYLLYSTCALSPLENDCLVQKLSKKFPDAKILSFQEVKDIFTENLANSSSSFDFQGLNENLLTIFNSSVKTDYGLHILPHKAGLENCAAGPIYFSLIFKESDT